MQVIAKGDGIARFANQFEFENAPQYCGWYEHNYNIRWSFKTYKKLRFSDPLRMPPTLYKDDFMRSAHKNISSPSGLSHYLRSETKQMANIFIFA